MTRAQQLAQRVEQGAQDFIAAVENLTEEQWRTQCPNEQRSVGVLVHHVGTMYPLEGDVVKTLAAEGEMPGLGWEAVDAMNLEHANANADVDKETAIDLVRKNSAIAAEAVRGLSDEDLDRVAPTGLHWDAPLTVQFFVEHHPIGHPYTHLVSIKSALNLS